MTRARSTVVLAALALAAIVGVLAVFQRDFSVPVVAPSRGIAPRPTTERDDVALHEQPESARVAADEITTSMRTAITSTKLDVAPETPPGSVSGRVTSSAKLAVANARVRLTLEHADELREVAELVTDSDGHYEGVIAELAAWSMIERETTRVLADVSADGYLPAQSWGYAATDGNRVRNLDVALDYGHVLSGRVVDEQGQPVAYAVVEAARYSEADGGIIEVRRGRLGETRCDARGQFLCGYSGGTRGQTWIVSATAPNIGCGQVVVRDEAERALPDVGDIVLHEFGVLAGRLTAADGKALPGVDLKISVVRAPTAGRTRPYRQREPILAQLQGTPRGEPLPEFTGRDSARAHTDERGNFRVAGLQPGTYTIRIEFGGVGDSNDNGALVEADGSAAFPTGSRALTLVANGAWIHARVVDAAGVAVSGIELEYAVLGERGSSDSAVAKSTTVELDQGETSHRFNAGARIALRARVGDRTTGEHVVEAPQVGVVDVVLALRTELAAGRMRVKIEMPDGDACTRYTVVLRSRASCLPVATYSWFDADADGWSPELPDGTYELVITTRGLDASPTPGVLPIVVDAATIGPSSKPDLALTAKRGGLLELTLQTPKPTEATAEDWYDESRRARCAVIDGSGRSIVLGGRSWSGADPDLTGLLLNRVMTAEPLLAPGAYRLHIESTRYATADVPVTIVAGETTKLTLELVPRAKD